MKKITTNYSLFEAFESQILGKTLNFVEKSHRSRFLNSLNEICNSLDFPISELSDDMFQYLPFKKALFLNSKSEDTPCDATSRRAFPEYSVDGEVCNGGMIKRKWGRGVRVVGCPICGGAGVKPKTSGDVKWLKFWFDKDGKYINATVTDGLIRNQISRMKMTGGMPPPTPTSGPFSKNLSDYEVFREIIGWQEVAALPQGTIVNINLQNGYTVGMVWRGGDGRTYILQDRDSGSYDTTNPNWRQYARESWVITDEACLRDRRVFILFLKNSEMPKSTEETVEDKVDPYTWNAEFFLSGKNIKVERNSNIDEYLKNAHFALVMDYKVFTAKEFKAVSKTKGERKEAKVGALSYKTDDEVRSANIRKYISQIADRLDVTEDFKNLPKIIVRLFGWNSAGIYVLCGRNFNTFNTIISYLFDAIKSTDEGTKKRTLEMIRDYLRSSMTSNIDYNDEVTRGFHRAYQYFQKNEEQIDFIKILDAHYEINKEVIDLIKRNDDIESIEDLDALYAKLTAVRRTYYETDRFTSMRSLDYFYRNIHKENNYEYLRQNLSYSTIGKVVETMNRFSKMISKL